MADSTDKDKPFAPFDEAQRKLIEEKVQRAKEKLLRETATPGARTEQSSVIPVIKNKTPDTDQKAAPIPSEPSESTEIKKPPATDYVAIGDQQRDVLRKTVEVRLQSKKLFHKVRKRLLSIAGKQANIDERFPYNAALLERGQTWSSLETSVISGPDVNTQRSVAELWLKKSGFYNIVAGYALDATGTWRKHVWLLAEHKVQEVTLKYAVYYGIPLSEKESKEFVHAVLGI